MALLYFNTDTTAAGSSITPASGDDVYVSEGTEMVSTGGNVIANGANDIDITVAGSLIAAGSTMALFVSSGTNSVTVTKTGTIYSATFNGVALGASTLATVLNEGTIRSDGDGNSKYAIDLNSPTAIIYNSGLIAVGAKGAGVINSNGAMTLVNTGDIVSFTGVNSSGSSVAIKAGGLADNIANSGHIVGNVNLNTGNDFYDGRGGTVVGVVDGGIGNDILVGGANADKFLDTNGSNWIVGGGGDDTVTISNPGVSTGASTIWGGDANFSSDNSLNDTLVVNGNAANIFLSGKVSDVVSGTVAAWIWGFENATGTFAGDSIIGTAGNNIINGSQGADWLVGNGGYDQFVFDSVSSNGSTISGFSADLIDLHNIDANTADTTDQAFLFKTVHTSNAAGEMVFTNFGTGGQIELYTNADNIVDATIFISYAAGSSAPTASDFWL